MFYYYGIDWTYLVLVLPAMIFALIAQSMVQSTFNKYSKTPTKCAMTGYQAARMVLDQNGIQDVAIERVSGNLTDHFDPRAKVIRLSDATYASSSAAAVGVAAHEAGHAAQYAAEYAPIKLRTAIIPITNIGSKLTIPLILLGAIFALQPLVTLGILFFALSTVFQLVTLPVEFNASKRAMQALRSSGRMDEGELVASRKVLTAAAMTYVAALAVSLMQLLRLILLFGRRSRD